MPFNMLRPLFYLFLFVFLEASTSELLETNSTLNLSCPFVFYQKVYNTIDVSFTEENLQICFKDRVDCVLVPLNESNSVEINNQMTPDLEELVEKTPNITEALTCVTVIKYHNNLDLVELVLASFGDQSAVGFRAVFEMDPKSDPMMLQTFVEGQQVNRLHIDASAPFSFTLTSGCRFEGRGYIPGVVHEFDSCHKMFCDESLGISFLSKCESGRCLADSGICLKNQICTVTGPDVIDVNDKIYEVQNRCSYILVDDWATNNSIVANFRDRRRMDVNFLNSISVISDGIQVVLEQDGSVWVDNVLVTINDTIEVPNVTLFKNQSGVYVKVEAFGRFLNVFFNGDIAQIQFEVDGNKPVGGLCGAFNNSETASMEEQNNCKTLYSDDVDPKINCAEVQNHCNMLKEAPFSSCNERVNPDPYIKSCSDTLCKHPIVDGLNCQFLWAYARACDLNKAPLGEWWSQITCPQPTPFCSGRICADHEFCGKKPSGEKGCLCRSVFAHKYRKQNILGEPTVCTAHSASVGLYTCLLEEKSMDVSVLHLRNESCRGEVDEERHMLNFTFNIANTCGAVITSNSSQTTYQNTIMSLKSSGQVITRQNKVEIDFSCNMFLPEMKPMALKIRDSTVITTIETMNFKYTVSLMAYTDPTRTQLLTPDTEVALNDKIWVEVRTVGLNPDEVDVVIESCWATDRESTTSSPKYYLIEEGCANPEDDTVKVERNGDGTSSYFSFNIFEFSGDSNELYLHFNLKLCYVNEANCIPACSGGPKRSRRSLTSKAGASALVSMAWTH